jgi:hypothetical protein
MKSARQPLYDSCTCAVEGSTAIIMHIFSLLFRCISWTRKFGIQSSPLYLVEFMVLSNDLERLFINCSLMFIIIFQIDFILRNGFSTSWLLSNFSNCLFQELFVHILYMQVGDLFLAAIFL